MNQVGTCMSADNCCMRGMGVYASRWPTGCACYRRPELRLLEADVGASGRTITRIFQKRTGVSHRQWRKQWRLMRAIELLATGHGISCVAAEPGFSSDRVFIAFFKQMLAVTPRAYLRKPAAD
jgi:AraC-like DNA-binding protein